MIFTMHLIISKRLEYKNTDGTEKQSDKEVKAKEETVIENVFIHLTT